MYVSWPQGPYGGWMCAIAIRTVGDSILYHWMSNQSQVASLSYTKMKKISVLNAIQISHYVTLTSSVMAKFCLCVTTMY